MADDEEGESLEEFMENLALSPAEVELLQAGFSASVQVLGESVEIKVLGKAGYVGNILNQQANGLGVLHYPLNDSQGREVYFGHFMKGKRHGVGVMMWTDGAKYEGDWVEDEPSGHGEEYYVDGAVYKGGFLTDMRHGSGSYQFTTERKYGGEWENGVRHGVGVKSVAQPGGGGEWEETPSMYKMGKLLGHLEPSDKRVPACLAALDKSLNLAFSAATNAKKNQKKLQVVSPITDFLKKHILPHASSKGFREVKKKRKKKKGKAQESYPSDPKGASAEPSLVHGSASAALSDPHASPTKKEQQQAILRSSALDRYLSNPTQKMTSPNQRPPPRMPPAARPPPTAHAADAGEGRGEGGRGAEGEGEDEEAEGRRMAVASVTACMERADALLGQLDYASAQGAYEETFRMLVEQTDSVPPHKAGKIKVSCLIGYSSSLLGVGLAQLAMEAAEAALELESGNIKALYRRARAQVALKIGGEGGG